MNKTKYMSFVLIYVLFATFLSLVMMIVHLRQ